MGSGSERESKRDTAGLGNRNLCFSFSLLLWVSTAHSSIDPFFFHIFYRLCTFFSMKKWEKKSFCRPEEISRHTRQCLCRHRLTLFFLNAIYNVRDSWECKNAVIYVSTSVTSCALLRFPWGYASISSLLLSHQVLCGIIKCVWCEAVGYRRGGYQMQIWWYRQPQLGVATNVSVWFW